MTVEFSNKNIKDFDLRKVYKKYPELENLEKWGMVHWAKPAPDGEAIVWTPDHDISADEVWKIV